VRAELDRKGISIAAWARQNNVSIRRVYDVLLGRTTGKYGEAHKAAVLLGMKDGEITDNTGGAA
jgi:gp16 family phage-associated protein